MDVITAFTCQEAQYAAAVRPPQILVVDYRLPDGDGISLQKKILSDLFPQTIQTIMISAFWDKIERQEASSEATYKLLDKPFNIKELVQTVNEALIIQKVLTSTQPEGFLPRARPVNVRTSKRAMRPRRWPQSPATPHRKNKSMSSQDDLLQRMKNVLIVFDSKLHADMCAMVFAPYAGCRVKLVDRSDDALEKLVVNPDVDLIILDIDTPEQDSFSFLKKTNSLNHHRVPIIMISKKSEKEDIREAAIAGACGYVIKPWRSSNFRKLVSKVLSS